MYLTVSVIPLFYTHLPIKNPPLWVLTTEEVTHTDIEREQYSRLSSRRYTHSSSSLLPCIHIKKIEGEDTSGYLYIGRSSDLLDVTIQDPPTLLTLWTRYSVSL